jgi:hypothetical protein
MSLQLHDLLSSSEEDILQAIRDDPAALRRAEAYSNLPIHIECQHQCRSAVLVKCIELYTESLSMANQADALPLHLLLSNKASSIEDALMMIEKYPAALRVDGCQPYSIVKYLPIHLECKNRCRSAVISKCIEIYPEALFEARDGDSLPLHLLLSNLQSSIHDALMMIEKYPEGLRCRDNPYFPFSKSLPIHIECGKQCRSAVLTKCIELYPESIAERVGENSFPLHLLLANSESSVDVILLFISKYPDALRCQDVDGYLPLHLECERQCRSPVIAKCIELYPEALHVTAKDDALPLHLLLLNYLAFMADVLLMIEKYPEALRCGVRQYYSDARRLPIHLECKNSCRPAILSKCIELYPESLAEASEEAYLPLHLLLSNPVSSVEMALLMIERYPEALKLKTKSYVLACKYLPIHLECKNSCRTAILSKCIELYPESLAEDDGQHMLPLSKLLSNSSASIDVILMVICAYPDALKCKEEPDLYLPIHVECANKSRSSIISKCIELYPESLSIASKNNSLPLHLLLTNNASSIEDALMMIDKYSEALHFQAISSYFNIKYLPIHVECKNRCRSAIISKCIELYPQSLSILSGSGTLPTHMLLQNPACSIEVAIMVIEAYPEALQSYEKPYYTNELSLPLHIECKNQCRSAVISKCIELYPESLSIPTADNALPLHLLLRQPQSPTDAALLMIDKYPEALKSVETLLFSDDKILPIHLECEYQCRSAVLSKCIELYPASLSITGRNNSLPLHQLLSSSVSTIDDALMMIDKNPQALKHKNNSYYSTDMYLPIHIESSKGCRSAVLLKCIKLYPESLSVCDGDGDIPWTIALKKQFLFSYDIIRNLHMSLFTLLSAHPASFYHPPHDPLIDKLPMMKDPSSCRLILNLLPSCLSSAAHLQAYHDLNWQPRSSLLHLWLQIRLKSDQVKTKSLKQLLSMTEPCHELSLMDGGMRILMMKMLKESSLLVAIDGRLDYGVDLGDGIDDLMLRFIMAYL